jgi:hypothetical protein
MLERGKGERRTVRDANRRRNNEYVYSHLRLELEDADGIEETTAATTFFRFQAR